MLTGCHQRLRVASPQFQRAPQVVICIVIVTDNSPTAEQAINLCRSAVEKKKR
jgi:uncharacterized protein with von Willebrand factor type A (vWA) domain